MYNTRLQEAHLFLVDINDMFKVNVSSCHFVIVNLFVYKNAYKNIIVNSKISQKRFFFIS